jgi:hypothetical protein
MTRRCHVFASLFLRLLSLKGYAELFRSAAHLFLPLKSSSSVLARESCVYRFLPELSSAEVASLQLIFLFSNVSLTCDLLLN